MRLTFDRSHVVRLLLEARAAGSSSRYSPFGSERGQEPALWMVGGNGVFIVNNTQPYGHVTSGALPEHAMTYAHQASPRLLDHDAVMSCKYYAWGPDDGVEVLAEDVVSMWLAAGSSTDVSALVHPFHVQLVHEGWRRHTPSELAHLIWHSKAEHDRYHHQVLADVQSIVASDATPTVDVLGTQTEIEVLVDMLNADIADAALAHALTWIDDEAFQDRIWRRYTIAADEMRGLSQEVGRTARRARRMSESALDHVELYEPELRPSHLHFGDEHGANSGPDHEGPSDDRA